MQLPILAALIVLVVGLLAAGIIIIFNLFGRNSKPIESVNSDEDIDVSEGSGMREKRTLSQTVDFYKGKQSYLEKQRTTAYEILDETGRSKEKGTLFLKCALFAAAGAIIGLIFDNNIPLIVVLACGLFMVPIWRLKLYRNKYRKYLSAQLESSVSLITMSYIRNGDIVKSVEENLSQISPLVRPHFKEFVSETAVNPSVKNCVRNLRDKINESLFHEWCEVLLRTLDNAEIREALLPITKKYSEVRVVQNEIDAGTARAIFEYVLMIFMDILAYPLVYFLNKEWWAYYATFPGKCVIAISCIIVFFCISRLITISQPAEFRR